MDGLIIMVKIIRYSKALFTKAEVKYILKYFNSPCDWSIEEDEENYMIVPMSLIRIKRRK